MTPSDHPLSNHATIPFEAALGFDIVGLHDNSSISLAIRSAAWTADSAIRLRIQVTSLDAMCRMIENGLGIGVLPLRAFEFSARRERLAMVRLSDAWAQRELVLIVKDEQTLSKSAQQLIAHLSIVDAQASAR